jgi:hypothetical protein
MYPEFVAMKAEEGFSNALAEAAGRQRITASEFMRQTLRKAIEAKGVDLPPFPKLRLGRKPR